MPSTRSIPRWVVALNCTILQICFGTVYAWSFFQSLLVKELVWSFTETAWAFSLAIFFLGLDYIFSHLLNKDRL
ncbi:MAG: OFA family oxalate/formate antiporter-like MFS transporter [Limisphaerales bacterium]|jgi:OFA family oxalate/formate antiporter-like MFS transporter